jgi:hypothetical protein
MEWNRVYAPQVDADFIKKKKEDGWRKRVERFEREWAWHYL